MMDWSVRATKQNEHQQFKETVFFRFSPFFRLSFLSIISWSWFHSKLVLSFSCHTRHDVESKPGGTNARLRQPRLNLVKCIDFRVYNKSYSSGDFISFFMLLIFDWSGIFGAVSSVLCVSSLTPLDLPSWYEGAQYLSRCQFCHVLLSRFIRRLLSTPRWLIWEA